MKGWKLFKKVLIGILGAFFLFVGLVVIPYFANIVMPWERANAIETALERGGLSELPASADIISVGITENMFSRGFTVEFICNEKDIDAWVEKSYGLKGIQPIVN